MRIVTARRISQAVFFGLFLWFAIVTVAGYKFVQMRGWPVNWFLQLDPLVAVGTALSTGTLYWPLLWGLVTIVLTIILGRFFCGWVCPFGSIHQFTGHLANRGKPVAKAIKLNQYRGAQKIKYYILFFMLGLALLPSVSLLQTGILDPIPLITRSFNTVAIPLAEQLGLPVSPGARFYEGSWLIFGIFAAAVLLNLAIPRFYCRFVCPLGALFGIIDRFAIWRIGKAKPECINCKLCERACEGGCEPTGKIRIAECVLCMNCLNDCRHDLSFQTQKSQCGEVTNPDISRRGVLLSLVGGVVAAPAIRLGDKLGQNWHNAVIRPPGALAESAFLERCIKCGQCMKICPTNVLQPAGIEGGIENLWTPVLNNRIGTSGCQLNCVSCGQVCPTAAIRPITVEEKLGIAEFADVGPIRLGTAFFDRNRCLPWAMDKPCLVCQENCPVSPKAIYTREVFNTVRDGDVEIVEAKGRTVKIAQLLPEGKYGTGDYYLAYEKALWRIGSNTADALEISEDPEGEISAGSKAEIKVRLQRPFVDVDRCIGCGVCEHECPVSGKRAIRVSAEGETRSHDRKLSV